MPTPNPPDPLTRPPRRRLGAALGLTGLFVALGAAHLATGAGAEPVDNSIAAGCTLGGGHVDVTVSLNVDDEQDPVVEGQQETLQIKTGAPSIPVEVTINKIVVTLPVPQPIASVDDVTFTGGNVTGSSAIDGSNVIVTFTGPVSSKDIQIPTITTVDTVRAGIAPTTISWTTFSQLVADTNYGTANCTPNDPNQVVNTTKVTSSASASTVDPSSTTSPTTSPSSPTTTEPGTTEPPPTTSTPPPTQPSSPGSPLPGVPLPLPPGAPSEPGVPSLPGAPPVPIPATPPLPVGCLPPPPVPPLPVPAPVPVPIPATGPCPTLPSVPTPPVPTPPAPPAPSGSTGVGVEVGVTVGASVSL